MDFSLFNVIKYTNITLILITQIMEERFTYLSCLLVTLLSLSYRIITFRVCHCIYYQ